MELPLPSRAEQVPDPAEMVGEFSDIGSGAASARQAIDSKPGVAEVRHGIRRDIPGRLSGSVRCHDAGVPARAGIMSQQSRAHRPAARGAGRRPVGGLVDVHAGVRPSRAPPPWRAADPSSRQSTAGGTARHLPARPPAGWRSQLACIDASNGRSEGINRLVKQVGARSAGLPEPRPRGPPSDTVPLHPETPGSNSCFKIVCSRKVEVNCPGAFWRPGLDSGCRARQQGSTHGRWDGVEEGRAAGAAAARGGQQRSSDQLRGLAALSLDALSSVAYGPEAFVLVLVAAGASALRLTLPVTLAIAGRLWFSHEWQASTTQRRARHLELELLAARADVRCQPRDGEVMHAVAVMAAIPGRDLVRVFLARSGALDRDRVDGGL
jgi:hypothetical protein